jgi:hypothetical protein
VELPPDIGGNRRPGTGGINQLRISTESSRKRIVRGPKRFGRHPFVNSAPQRRRSPVEGGSTHVVVGET